MIDQHLLGLKSSFFECLGSKCFLHKKIVNLTWLKKNSYSNILFIPWGWTLLFFICRWHGKTFRFSEIFLLKSPHFTKSNFHFLCDKCKGLLTKFVRQSVLKDFSAKILISHPISFNFSRFSKKFADYVCFLRRDAFARQAHK